MALSDLRPIYQDVDVEDQKEAINFTKFIKDHTSFIVFMLLTFMAMVLLLSVYKIKNLLDKFVLYAG